MSDPVTEAIKPEQLLKVKTLGSVQLHHKDTKQVILVPTPSDDINDPLNWSKGFRYYIGLLSCFAVFINNFAAAGPAITIALQTIEFFGPPGPDFLSNVGKISYFFTATALVDGLGILFWMPIIVKYGRRPVYIISYGSYAACNIWAGVAKTYGSELAARIFVGFFSSAGLAVAPLTIADLFFLHERGAVMAWYTTSLVGGGALGNVIAGLITINYTWRTTYYVTTALVGLFFVLMFFTMPETSFKRNQLDTANRYASDANEQPDLTEKGTDICHVQTRQSLRMIGNKKTYLEQLRMFSGVYVDEPLLKIFLRPFGVLLLPPVFWSTIVTAVSVGFVIAVNTNIGSAYQMLYGWKTYQIGLAYLSAFVGALLGIFGGGHFSDWVANVLTKRNNGVREPEMRLPSLMVAVVLMTASLVLYGAGIQKGLHWMVPTFALGLLTFAASLAMNVAMVYSIDSYRPIAGECIVAILGFKACITFLLSFYTNPWAQKEGYLPAFGAMGGIAGGITVLWIVFYIWGKQIRHATIHWKMFSWIDWHDDREVGE